MFTEWCNFLSYVSFTVGILTLAAVPSYFSEEEVYFQPLSWIECIIIIPGVYINCVLVPFAQSLSFLNKERPDVKINIINYTGMLGPAGLL